MEEGDQKRDDTAAKQKTTNKIRNEGKNVHT